jgi:hypothetical protein
MVNLLKSLSEVLFDPPNQTERFANSIESALTELTAKRAFPLVQEFLISNIYL